MKSIKIESPTHLWSLIKSKEEIFESNRTLKRFIFVTEKFIKDCQCGSNNKELMENEYKVIYKSEEIINLLKEELGVDELIFTKL